MVLKLEPTVAIYPCARRNSMKYKLTKKTIWDFQLLHSTCTKEKMFVGLLVKSFQLLEDSSRG